MEELRQTRQRPTRSDVAEVQSEEELLSAVGKMKNSKVMRDRVRLERTMLEEIQAQNGLQHGCCMAPVLLNLYTCLAVERWLERV